MLKKLEDIINNLKISEKIKLVVAAAQDKEVLHAVLDATRMNIIEPILVGDINKIKEIAKQLKFSLENIELINADSYEEAAEISVKLVSNKKADFIMKGILDTSILLKSVLNKEYGLRTDSLLSHVMIYELPEYHKLLILTDGGMNISPNYEQKMQIVNNAIKACKALGADEVIVATGATAKKIPVKGADTAIEAIDYLLGNAIVGENVTIIGGGLTGCEIAYELYLKGKKPTIVEMQDDLITTKGICLANTSFLRDFFKTNKVPVHLETSLCEILKDGVTVKDKDGKTFKIDADSVIMSVGYNPAPLATKGKRIHVVGDANNVGNLRTVIWGAWDVCMKL